MDESPPPYECPDEYPECCAIIFIENDYMQEWFQFLDLIDNKTKRPHVPKSFSERYPNMRFHDSPFTVTESEREKIEELDRLSIEAGRLISAQIMDSIALLKIAIRVAEICNRQDVVEQLTKGL